MAAINRTCACACFSWCDHSAPGEHESAAQSITLPGSAEPVLAAAAVVHDELDVSGVSLRAGRNDGAVLSPSEADAFADRLIAFASQVRSEARMAAASRRLPV